MPVTKTAYIFTTALKSAQRKGGADVKKRRYHGQSRKKRLLAVMLVMAMLLGMSTISVYAGELTGDISMEQVDVDVGEAGTQKDTRTRLMVEPGQAQSLAGSEVRLSKAVALTGSGIEKRSD